MSELNTRDAFSFHLTSAEDEIVWHILLASAGVIYILIGNSNNFCNLKTMPIDKAI